MLPRELQKLKGWSPWAKFYHIIEFTCVVLDWTGSGARWEVIM